MADHNIGNLKNSNKKTLNTNPKYVYKPLAGDVIIAGPIKSGTTWLQQILHQIRTKGDESFSDIYDVTWFFDYPKLENYFNFNAEQVCNPRIYKCHCLYENIPRAEGVKYVVIVRNPYDLVYSYMKFTTRFWGKDKDMDEETVMRTVKSNQHTTGKSSLLFIASWWLHRRDSNVFWIHYEDLLRNLELVVKKLANFIGVYLSDEELKKVCSFCTYEYMSVHTGKFKGKPLTDLIALSMGKEKWKVHTSMVRVGGGKVGEGAKQLGPKIKQLVEELWKEIIQKKFGLENYAEMYEEGTQKKKISML